MISICDLTEKDYRHDRMGEVKAGWIVRSALDGTPRIRRKMNSTDARRSSGSLVGSRAGSGISQALLHNNFILD